MRVLYAASALGLLVLAARLLGLGAHATTDGAQCVLELAGGWLAGSAGLLGHAAARPPHAPARTLDRVFER